MKFWKSFAGLAIAASCISPLPAQATQSIGLTLATGHPEVFPHVRFLGEVFVPEVDRILSEAGGHYAIQWRQAYGGTLVRTGSELQALQQGIIDVAFVPTLFSGAQLPLEQVTYQAPFLSPDDQVIRTAMENVRERFPEYAAAWAAFGATVLSPGNICDDYALMLKEPASSLADLAGRRIFAPGPTANWLKETGAVAVAGNMSEYYQGLQTGIADGVIVLTSAAYPGKYHEVAPHFMHAGLGAQWCSTIAINTSRLEGLPEVVRDALAEAAQVYSTRLMEAVNATMAEHVKKMQEEGATIGEWPEEERAKWAAALPNIATEWAEAMEGQGLPGSAVLEALLEEVRAAGAEPLRDWTQ